MPIIKIDNQDYDLDSLSDEAKAQLGMLRMVDQKIAELQRDMAIAQTARNAYSKAMNEALPTPLEQVMQGETIKLS